MNTYGGRTNPTVVVNHESHKLHLEFVAGAAIGRSQPVKLNSSGAVVPLAAGDNRNLCIGFSIHFGAVGDNVTVVCKPFLTLLCQADGEVAPGPVQIVGYFQDPDLGNDKVGPKWGVNTVATATATDVDFLGLAIEGGADEALIRVVMFA